MDNPLRRYWDSTNFISLIGEDEPQRADVCQHILEDAEKGDTEIVISALTIAEVIKPKGRQIVDDETEKKLADFFLHEYISVYDVTRQVAERARRLARQYALKPNDAIHLATAQISGAEVFETYNNNDFQHITDAGIIIREPSWQGTPDFFKSQ